MHICLAVVCSPSHLCFPKLSCPLWKTTVAVESCMAVQTQSHFPHIFQQELKVYTGCLSFKIPNFQKKTPSALLDEGINFFLLYMFSSGQNFELWRILKKHQWKKTSTRNLSFKYKATPLLKAPINHIPPL